MIGAILELLLQIVIEIVGEVLFELFVTLGWESLVGSIRSNRRFSLVTDSVALFLLGLFASAMTLLIVRRRLSPYSPLPGVSLLLAPLGTGLVMHRLGDVWEEHGKPRPVLFSFRAGALFAFGMAFARFVYIELQWRPF